jgi:hypothetical protein
VRSQQNLLSSVEEIGEIRESELIGAETHKHDPPWEPLLRNEYLNCNKGNAEGSMWASLRVKNSRRNKLQDSHYS